MVWVHGAGWKFIARGATGTCIMLPVHNAHIHAYKCCILGSIIHSPGGIYREVHRYSSAVPVYFTIVKLS